MGPPTPKGPTIHTGVKCIGRHHRNVGASIHHFLNLRNATVLQKDCALTYTGKNIYLPKSLWQALLQGHSLEIPGLDAPTGISPFLTPPALDGPVNSQQGVMQVQVIFSMGQDCLSKE